MVAFSEFLPWIGVALIILLPIINPISIAVNGVRDPSLNKSYWKQVTVGGHRPSHLYLPSDKNVKTPLLIILHGYGSDGEKNDFFLNFRRTNLNLPFMLLTPNGTFNKQGLRFWNATNACCNFDNNAVDDVAYLERLITEVQQKYPIDPKRVYVIGHSNGAFMALRFACAHPNLVAAVISVAGANFPKETQCAKNPRVSILLIHGDQDRTVLYHGGKNFLGHIGPQYPGAEETLKNWGKLNGCSSQRSISQQAIDIDSQIPGAETTITKVLGCPPPISVALWTIHGASHVPRFSEGFFRASWKWMMDKSM